jgi:hypothetical protein
MAQDASLVGAVQRFAAALHESRRRIFADLYPISNVADLLSAVRSAREVPREGFTSSGFHYTVHGSGCRMTAPDGSEVDVDLVVDPVLGHPVEAFDVWRIRWFLDEAVRDGYSHEDIAAACNRLAEEGRLREVVARCWYALPNAPERPH